MTGGGEKIKAGMKIDFFKNSKFLVFVLILGWVFSGRPAILSFAQEATSTAETATSTAGIATSTPPVATATSTPETSSETSTSTPVSATSTPEGAAPALEAETATPPSSDETASGDAAPAEEEEITPPGPPEQAAPPLPPPPPLKERKLDKQVHFDKEARHSCVLKNFTINISGHDKTILEFKLEGARSDFENLEIGSLPLGIDITFLNNAGYSWRPQKNDNIAVLQITNQAGSQKGNFNIPIIYQSGDSTTACQVNVINF